MFYNLDPNIKPKNLLDILKWKMTSKKSEWLPLSQSVTTDIPPITNDKNIRVTYVGHVTFLIQVQGLNILTDPVWSERTSPFIFAGPKRVVKPGIDFVDLPKIDFILISHNHYDHLDIKTIKDLWLRDNPKIITPLKNDVIIKKYIKDAEIITLGWGESYKNQNVEYCLEPAQHLVSQRNI